MKWEKVKLGKYVEILSGFAFKSKDFLNCGVPVIKIKNITQEGVTLEDVSYISKELADKNEKYHLDYNDILIALTGSHINQMSSVVGRIARIKYHEDSLLNQRVGKVFAKDSKLCDIDYVYYFLSQDYIKISLASKAGGAANQANISPNDVKSLTVRWPDIETQHRIADILSAYDDLIENNQKQIKLLEEAAQRLYKEWFVNLRFPGHENTKIVDGVPEGWSKTNINEILTFHRGYDLTKNEMKAGRYPVVGSTTVIGYHNEFKINGPGIATGRSGSLGKYQFIWDNFWPHNTSLYISDYKDHNIFFVYSLLQTVDFASLNNGGAIPTLNRNVLSNIEVIEPEKKLQDVFAKIAEPQYQKIRNLEKQNDRLKTARDLLLPKLMSGEVEV
jgi:type I restriction enzyme S subunit